MDIEFIRENLPASKSKEDIEKRKKIFRLWDNNGNGYLSCAEIDKALC